MSSPNLPADRATQDVELLTPKERGYNQRLTSFDIGTMFGVLLWSAGVWLTATVLSYQLRPENLDPGTVQILLAVILVILGIRVQLKGPSVRTGVVALVPSLVFLITVAINQPGNSAWVWGCGVVGSGLAVVAAAGVLVAATSARR